MLHAKAVLAALRSGIWDAVSETHLSELVESMTASRQAVVYAIELTSVDIPVEKASLN